jgi:Zn-finger nucleic acid-binding protein
MAWPYPLRQLLLFPGFAPGLPIRNRESNREGPAQTFPRIAKALGLTASAASTGRGSGKCPRCHTPLAEMHYEGVPIEACPRCRGKLVETGGVARIVARKEVRFSEAILQEARRRRETFLHGGQRKTEGTVSHEAFPCPRCGSKMLPRPYSYNYFIPVEKCLACRRIWFDADELEILQAMIEETRG